MSEPSLFPRGVSVMLSLTDGPGRVCWSWANVATVARERPGEIVHATVTGHRRAVVDTAPLLETHPWVKTRELDGGRRVWIGWHEDLGLVEAVSGPGWTYFYQVLEPLPCPACHGTRPTCATCDGTGEKPERAPWDRIRMIQEGRV